MHGHYQKNMTQAKGGLPIFLQGVDTNLAILCNVWVEDSSNKVTCIRQVTGATEIKLLIKSGSLNP
jgi:hypothetical protein